MDTITHGIAGALIAKAAFRGQDMLGAKPVNRERIITWSLMLGAIFPDSDVFREFFSHNDLLILTWHRSVTHSLVCLPIFAVALAALTRWLVRWRKWEGPSFLPAVVILAAWFRLPGVRGWGLQVRLASWNLAGLLIALGYIGAAAYAHHVALERVDKFSSSLHLEVQSLGALPFPPSLWHWDGLVLTPRVVYELRVNLGGDSKEVQAAGTVPDAAYSLNYSFYPNAPPNPYIQADKQLPDVRTVLWFARFPVTRFHKEGAEAVVEISDLRFPQMKPGRPSSFTYRVRFAQDGTVMSRGWVKTK